MIKKIWLIFRYPFLASTIALGIFAILSSYQLSPQQGPTFGIIGLFWFGYFVAVIPQIVVILHPDSQFWSRVASLASIGIISALPQILLSPNGPSSADEFGHIKAVSDILEQGYISPINSIVAPIPEFPALHYLTAYIADISQFSLWTSANLVIALTHVLTLLGIFALLRVKISPRAAAIGALVYAANPNWMFFQSRFAYESLAIMVALWALFFLIRGLESPFGQRLIMIIIAGPAFFVLSQTHHLIFIATLVLAILYLAIYAVKNYKTDGTSLSLAVGSGIWAALWSLPTIANNGKYLVDYISYTIAKPSQSNLPFLMESLGLASSETLLEEASFATEYFSFPLSEIIAGSLLPFILFSILWFYLHQGAKSSQGAITFVKGLDAFQTFALVISVSYFITLPLIAFGEYALVRRSWSFVLLGFAILAAVIYENYLLNTPKQQRARPPYWKQINAAVMGIFIAVSVSSVSVGSPLSQRFPVGAEQSAYSINSLRTAEVEALAEWAATGIPDNTWVFADRYTRLILTYPSRLMAAPIDSVRFPYWELYLDPQNPNEQIIKSAKALGVEYIFAHKFTFLVPTESGYWFHPSEKKLYSVEELYSYNLVEEFDKASWAETVWDSDNYVVYRVDWDAALEVAK